MVFTQYGSQIYVKSSFHRQWIFEIFNSTENWDGDLSPYTICFKIGELYVSDEGFHPRIGYHPDTYFGGRGLKWGIATVKPNHKNKVRNDKILLKKRVGIIQIWAAAPAKYNIKTFWNAHL